MTSSEDIYNQKSKKPAIISMNKENNTEADEIVEATEKYNIITNNQNPGTSSSFNKVAKTSKNNAAQDKTKNSDRLNTKNNLLYQKRSGSAGVCGQLYETKLLTLVLIRAVNETSISEFYLGTNISGVGALDDICLRYKRKDDNKDVIIFIQAKHRNNVDSEKITMNDVKEISGDFGVGKYFDSYLQIREKIIQKSDDVVFNGDINDLDCNFIIYTPAKHIIRERIHFNENSTKTNEQIRALIETNCHGDIFQLKYDHVDFITDNLIANRIKLLAKLFVEFIYDKKRNTMDGKYELIKSYHVVLAENIVKVSEDSVNGIRQGTFRQDFLDNHEKQYVIFKHTLYSELVKRRLCDDDNARLHFFSIHEKPTAEKISKVIGNYLEFDEKTNRFRLICEDNTNIIEAFKNYLQDKQVNTSVVKNAIEIAGKQIILSKKFELHESFGNIDIAVRGITSKVENRLDFLAKELLKMIDNATDRNGLKCIEINDDIVGPNKLLQKGVVAVNGGLGSAVGNLLIHDKNTDMLKFNNSRTLPTNAQYVWNKLKNKVHEIILINCRFKFCLNGFPKLSFTDDEYEKSISKHFISKLWFYTGQAKEDGVEKILKNEIDKCFNEETNSASVFRVKTDAMFLKIHDEIQKWWMQPDQISYLTHNTDIFNRGMDIVDNPLVSIFNLIHTNKHNNMGIEFEADAVKSLNLDTFSKGLVIITTSSNILTNAKLIQHFKGSNDHAFVDFNYIISFTLIALECIVTELEAAPFETLIISVETSENDSIFDQLNNVLNRLNNKRIIVVTNKQFHVAINEDNNVCIVIRNDETCLNDLTLIAHQKIMNDSKVIFQGVEVNLETIINDDSKHLIKTDTLSKLLNKQVFSIGKSLTSSNYDKIKDFYVHRNLSREEKIRIKKNYEGFYEPEDYEDVENGIVKSYDVNSLLELNEDIIVVTATPGMGKSTLLTYLSLETKKRWPDVWIARINLLDYTKQFRTWQQTKAAIDDIKTIEFLCKAITNASDNHELLLERTDNEIRNVRNTDDIETLLELDFFFHCYKNGKLIFLFDGFDEICPHYEKEVIQLIKRTVNVTLAPSLEKVKHKVWIASRSYNNVKFIIEREFGKSYTLQPLCTVEQKVYLEKFWKKHMNLEELTHEQFLNIDSFIKYMLAIDNKETNTVAYVKLISKPLRNMYFEALEYFQHEVKDIPLSDDKEVFRKDWDFDSSRAVVLDVLMNDAKNENKALVLSGTPLHMHIAADFFQNEIKHNLSSDQTNKWDLDMNTFGFYERFLEMKLTKIQLEEKNEIDLSKPDNIRRHDKERKEFMEEHKKLAFYAMFKHYSFFDELISEDERQEIQDMVENIKFAKEKTGVIDCVVDDAPRFVHRVFAEYFAIEYICDLLKTAYSLESLKRQRDIWTILFQSVMTDRAVGAFNIFDRKLFTDKRLSEVIESDDTKAIVSEFLTKQTSLHLEKSNKYYFEDVPYHRRDFLTALDNAVSNGLEDTANYLLMCVVEKITSNDYFECLITENKLIYSAIAQGFDNIVEMVLNNLRRIGGSIYSVLRENDFDSSSIYTIVDKTNAEIINVLYTNYNRKIDDRIASFYAKLFNDIFKDTFPGLSISPVDVILK